MTCDGFCVLRPPIPKVSALKIASVVTSTLRATANVYYNIRHLPLNKDNSFANALEWTADVKVHQVVLQSNMSLTSSSPTVKVCSSGRRLQTFGFFLNSSYVTSCIRGSVA